MARERAQLVLIAGIGIAVTFVALALILNTVIYTENLATRSTADGEAAITVEDAAITGVNGLISEANYHDYDSYGALARAFDRGVAAFTQSEQVHRATHGTLLNVSVDGTTNGTHVVQESNRTLANADGDANWDAARNVDGVRAFRLNLSANSLDSGDALGVTVDGSDPGDAWTGTLSADSTGTPTLTTGGETYTATDAGQWVTLDVTGGTFNGTALSAIDLPENGPYTIKIANGGDATGRYAFVVDQRYSDFGSQYGGFFEPEYPYSNTVSESPYAVRGIYSADVTFTYRSESVAYTNTPTLRPEEKPGGEPFAVAVPRGILNYVTDAGDTLNAFYSNGTHTGYAMPAGVTATSIGPETNLDGDEAAEFPVVYDNKSVALVDESTGETDTIAVEPNAQSSNALLWTGSFRGGSTAVWYAGDSRDFIHNATTSSVTAEAYDVSSNGISAVAGAADIDGSGADELVYVDGSGQLRYVTAAGVTEQKIENGGTGANYGPGVGRPYDFDGDGTARVPFVDGSNNLKLIGAGGTPTTVVSGNVAKAPLGVFDVDTDGSMEIVFVQDGSLYYVDDVTGTPNVTQLTDSDGDPVTVVEGPGAA
ncbi:DUF7261 family protein [Halocalculus aciditolerans]|uniref:Uncharacterized protein n=1 Tax=Halocalculus aciditolerans TaxID=1383812 RepID=A0A830FCI5_9EURY|nr:hypothetical protein [Halocalculus aciditolerans]GGL61064.1 hypothetical protein GCM10009039_19000 [Halocalculus aciditolerans]